MHSELCSLGRFVPRRKVIERFVAPSFAAFAAFALSACYPTLPSPLAEGTEVLGAGKVAFTGAGAGAIGATAQPAPNPSITTAGGGGLVRVRVGLGAKQEIGLGGVMAIGTGSAGSEPPFTAAGIISYKVAPVDWLAFVADGGIQWVGIASSVVSFGGDVAAIVAPYRAQNGSQLYTGARGGLSVPILQGAHALNESVTVPIGYSLALSEKTRLMFEGGFILGFTQLTNELANQTAGYTSYGGYGLVGVRYQFN